MDEKLVSCCSAIRYFDMIYFQFFSSLPQKERDQLRSFVRKTYKWPAATMSPQGYRSIQSLYLPSKCNPASPMEVVFGRSDTSRILAWGALDLIQGVTGLSWSAGRPVLRQSVGRLKLIPHWNSISEISKLYWQNKLSPTFIRCINSYKEKCLSRPHNINRRPIIPLLNSPCT